MKKIKFLLTITVCILFIIPVSIHAEEKISNNTNIIDESDSISDVEFVDLSREEFNSKIAENNGITYNEARDRTNKLELQGLAEMAANGEIMPRALNAKQGYFKANYYTSNSIIYATFGVYATYYLPSGNTSWTARKFTAVHDKFVYAGTYMTLVNTLSCSAPITNQYTIGFAAIIDMKTNMPGMYYVKYNIRYNFGL